MLKFDPLYHGHRRYVYSLNFLPQTLIGINDYISDLSILKSNFNEIGLTDSVIRPSSFDRLQKQHVPHYFFNDVLFLSLSAFWRSQLKNFIRLPFLAKTPQFGPTGDGHARHRPKTHSVSENNIHDCCSLAIETQ